MTQRARIRVSTNGVLVVVASYKVGECYGIKCTVQSELVAGTILNTVCVYVVAYLTTFLKH